tara:strand:+ start:241 stop:429 length:189 start_codon:yes stop_codon:yes gene_type:complete
MKTLIIIFSLLTISTHTITEPIYNEPETCYCTIDGTSWTAYCGPDWTCEKCCEKTKPKKKDE